VSETVLVSTCGQGIMWSSTKGERWWRLDLWQDIEYDAIVRCVTAHPTQPATIFAGYDKGICVSEDAGVNWRRLSTPMDGWQVWQIAVDRNNPERIYAGSGAPSPARVMKSMDGGSSWTMLSPELPEFCLGVHKPRVVTLTLDPIEGNEVWFGVEESGLFRSRDDGESWERVDDPNGGVQNSDIHSIVILEGPPKTHIVVVVNAVHVSHDDGATWKSFDAREAFGLRYSRIAQAQPGSNHVFLGVGDGTPGTTTKIWRSRDLGESWEEISLSESANSCTWAFAAHPSDPDKLFFGTKFGNLYRSEDGGASWKQEWRVFSEITDIAWLPVAAEPPDKSRYHHGPEPIE